MNESTPATEPGRTLTPEQQALVDEFCRSLAGDESATAHSEPETEPTEAPTPEDLTSEDKALFDQLEKLFPLRDEEPRNTITGQPREFDHISWEDRQMRRAWALFGALIAERVLSMPNFDLLDEIEIVEAAEDVKHTVESIYLALEKVLDGNNSL